MKYAFVLVYLAVVLLADRALPAAGAGAAVLRRRAAPCAALWLVLLLLFSLNTNNRLYTASAQAHRATLSYATRCLPHRELPRLHPRDAGLSHRLFPHRPGPQQRGGLARWTLTASPWTPWLP